MQAPIDPRLRISAVRLAVSDLARSIAFYARVLGLALLSRDEQSAVLGAGEERRALALSALPDPTAASPRDTGLFHVAWLHPSRAALAATVRRPSTTTCSASQSKPRSPRPRSWPPTATTTT